MLPTSGGHYSKTGYAHYEDYSRAAIYIPYIDIALMDMFVAINMDVVYDYSGFMIMKVLKT